MSARFDRYRRLFSADYVWPHAADWCSLDVRHCLDTGAVIVVATRGTPEQPLSRHEVVRGTIADVARLVSDALLDLGVPERDADERGTGAQRAAERRLRDAATATTP